MPMIPDLTPDEAMQGGGYSPCPIGWHAMKIVDVDVQTKPGKGDMHVVEFEALDADCAGTQARDNFCLWVGVGRGRYKGLLTAVGFTTFAGLSTDLLKGRTLRVLVEHEQFIGQDGTPKLSAKAKAFEALTAGGQQPSQPQQAAPVQQPQARPAAAPAPQRQTSTAPVAKDLPF